MLTTKKLTTLFLCFAQFCFSQIHKNTASADFVIAFGSCNKPTSPQPFWNEIIKNDPNVFIWLGDNIYGDSDDMGKLENDYRLQNNNVEYKKLISKVPVIGTWDDHDYGKNDAGAEWEMKKESQTLFLNFLGIPQDDPRRKQEGIYTSKVFETEKGSIKVLILDTRYFRSPLKKSTDPNFRYEPYVNDEGTILGEMQWKWLEKELENNYSDFIVIVSSIQFLSHEHGFETWGNFPHEIKRLKSLLVDKAVRNAIILSGDRHLSEFSMIKIKGLRYPLIDFTSSGLTHAYTDYQGESNRYRVGRVISKKSFGLLTFDLDTYEVSMQMRGENNVILQEFNRQYSKK